MDISSIFWQISPLVLGLGVPLLILSVAAILENIKPKKHDKDI
jgi:hypothetical protein